MNTKRTKKKVEYYGGHIKPLIEMVARMVAKNPALADSPELLHETIRISTPPELKYSDPAQCFNCRRSMKVTVYTADIFDGMLMLAMAKAVRENVLKGRGSFTDANKVHMPTLAASNAVVKRQTKCDYLGLIKQPDNWRGTGYWLVTGWGWKLLAGEKIPKAAKHWEGRLISRSEELTTLGEMFQTHTDRIKRLVEKRKAVGKDYRAIYADYNPSEWSDFEGVVPSAPPVQALQFEE